jgi:hypothetical protein
MVAVREGRYGKAILGEVNFQGIRELLSGDKSAALVAKAYGIHPNTARICKNKLLENGPGHPRRRHWDGPIRVGGIAGPGASLLIPYFSTIGNLLTRMLSAGRRLSEHLVAHRKVHHVPAVTSTEEVPLPIPVRHVESSFTLHAEQKLIFHFRAIQQLHSTLR